jgi:two-component system, OmpR family, sensor histidine kinase TctE
MQPLPDPFSLSGGALKHRLLLLLLGPLLALLVAGLLWDYKTAIEPSNEAYDHALADNAMAIAARLMVHDDRVEVDLPAPAEAVLVADQVDRVLYSVWGPKGEHLAGNVRLEPQPDGYENPHFADDQFGNRKVRSVTYRAPTTAGVVTVTVAETTGKRDHTAASIVAAMVAPNILLVIATLLIVYAGVRVALKPLDRLGEDIARRSPHDLRPLPDRDVPQEARPLVSAINGLIGDLRASAAAQQSFLANAAHQLRTPLAGLQTQLDLVAEDVPAALRPRIAQTRDATQRLGHLAHQLLSLARSGTEANIVHEWQTLNLGSLLEEVAPEFLDAAIAKGIDLGFEAHSARVNGSRWLLRELVANLLDNAIRYTPSGGRVTARSGTDATGRPWLEVEDNGPGIPEPERERVFERFYRASGTADAGAGLGLAIVREVADRHEAAISLAVPANGVGTCIRLTFRA